MSLFWLVFTWYNVPILLHSTFLCLSVLGMSLAAAWSCILESQCEDPCLFNGEFSPFINIVIMGTHNYFHHLILCLLFTLSLLCSLFFSFLTFCKTDCFLYSTFHPKYTLYFYSLATTLKSFKMHSWLNISTFLLYTGF